jgi:hypothetical protein
VRGYAGIDAALASHPTDPPDRRPSSNSPLLHSSGCPASHSLEWVRKSLSAMNSFLDRHAIWRNIARHCTLQEGIALKSFIDIGAASGDRTHDILSHSQAFCR